MLGGRYREFDMFNHPAIYVVYCSQIWRDTVQLGSARPQWTVTSSCRKQMGELLDKWSGGPRWMLTSACRKNMNYRMKK